MEALTIDEALLDVELRYRAMMASGEPAARPYTLPAPHVGQQRVLDEASRFNVLECGRRFGKTTLGVRLACQIADEQSGPVGWFAPTYKMLLEQWNELVALLAPITEHASKVDGQIRLKSGGKIDFWSLDKPDAGRGRKYKRVIIDEASLIRSLRDAWTGAVRPTLADYQGDAWFFGTPKGRNYFHQLFVKGQSGDNDWRSWRFGTVANPHIAADEVEAARKDLPADAFAQEFEGVPAEDGANPFGVDAIRSCVVPAPSSAPTHVFGVDLAKSVDWTWIVGLDADGAQTVSDRFQAPWGVTIPRIEQRVGRIDTLVDATGVGDPIVETLQRGRSNFSGFKFTATSKQQLMESLRLAIQRREVRVYDPQLVNELESFEFNYTRTGVTFSAPQGLHDDGVMALALAVWHRREARPPGDLGVTL